MEKIGLMDVKIIVLGIKNGDRIDEKILDESELKKAGTGYLLDTLASLQERGLISLSKDKSFHITNSAKQILWNQEIPLWVKVLRILDISSSTLEKISQYLNEDKSGISSELERLRKNQLVVMSALRTEQTLEQTFEILPEGLEELQKIKEKGYEHASPRLRNSNVEVFELLAEITEKVKSSELPHTTKNDIIQKISKVQAKLDV